MDIKTPPTLRLHGDIAAMNAEIEAAALIACNLLHVASRELPDNLDRGLSLVDAAERYVADVLTINARLCAAIAQS